MVVFCSLRRELGFWATGSRHSAKIVRRTETWVKYTSVETFCKWQKHHGGHIQEYESELIRRERNR